MVEYFNKTINKNYKYLMGKSFRVSGKRKAFLPPTLVFSHRVFRHCQMGSMQNSCVLFGRNYGGRGALELRSLVANPFVHWKKGKQLFDSYSKADNHEFSVEKIQGFKSVNDRK